MILKFNSVIERAKMDNNQDWIELYEIIKSLNYFILNRITFVFPLRQVGRFKDFKGKWLVISSILFAM